MQLESTDTSQLQLESTDTSQLQLESTDTSQLQSESTDTSQLQSESTDTSQLQSESTDTSQLQSESTNTSLLATVKDQLGPDLVLPSRWTDVSGDSQELRLCVVTHQGAADAPCPLVISHSVVVDTSRSWKVHVHGHLVDTTAIPLLADTPSTLDGSSTTSLLQKISRLNICAGNPDPKFIDLAKTRKNAQFLSASKSVVAYLDRSACVSVNCQYYAVTVRCTKCHLLTCKVRCQECLDYRRTLNLFQSRLTQKDTAKASTSVNHRYSLALLQ